VARRPGRLALLENPVSAVPRRTSCRLLLSVDSLGRLNLYVAKKAHIVGWEIVSRRHSLID